MELFCAKLESGIMRYCMSEMDGSNSIAPKDIIGDEVDWMDTHGYLYMAFQVHQNSAQYQSYVDHVARLTDVNESLSQQVTYHTNREAQLRKQLTTSQIEYDESISSLMDKVTTLENQLSPLSSENAQLRHEIGILKNKLIEVESFVDSDNGRLLIQMENELAESKLRLADVECENDDLKVAIQKLKMLTTSSGKENSRNTLYVR